MGAIWQGIDGVALPRLDSIATGASVRTSASATVQILAAVASVGDPLTRRYAYAYSGLAALRPCGLAAFCRRDVLVAGANAAKQAPSLLPEDRKGKVAVIEGARRFAAAWHGLRLRARGGRAVEVSGSKAPLVATSGGSAAGLEAVKAIEFDGTVCMPWETVGRLLADALYAAATNPNAEKGRANTIDAPLITAANLSDCPAQW